MFVKGIWKTLKMKILISNHHFFRYAGTETYTQTLIKYLSKYEKNEIFFYSHYLNPEIGKWLINQKVHLISSLEDIESIKFDIIHVHHNINVVEIRHYFPNVPIVMQLHGVIPFLEQPPVYNAGINLYLTVSEEVQQNLIKSNVSFKKIKIFRNIIDESQFFETKKVNKKLQKILVFSNYDNIKDEKIIKSACKDLKIELDFIGGKYGQIAYNDLNSFLNNYDLVVTVGRSALETILAGRIPLILKDSLMDGIVTPKNFKEMMKNNFSGRRFSLPLTKENFIKEINKYQSKNVEKLVFLTKNFFGSKLNILNLIDIYNGVIKSKFKPKFDKRVNEFIFNVIKTTREYEQFVNYPKLLSLENEIKVIKSSQFYKLWPIYNKVKHFIKVFRFKND